jgi:hypothetical protein
MTVACCDYETPSDIRKCFPQRLGILVFGVFALGFVGSLGAMRNERRFCGSEKQG